MTQGILCLSHIYKFGGFEFEWHPYCGPAQLNKDGSHRAHPTMAFWGMVDTFQRLSEEERQACKIQGGCIPFGWEDNHAAK